MMITKVPALCRECGWDRHYLYELAAREEDPLPVRYLPGKVRGGFVLRSEFEEWIRRNAPQYRERGKA